MTLAWVELSLENLPLARAELEGALEALGGRVAGPPVAGTEGALVPVDLPDAPAASALAGRLAFGRRVLSPWTIRHLDELAERLRLEGSHGHSACFRPLRGGRSPLPAPELLALAAAYKAGGGRIDLVHPQRRFWAVAGEGPGWRLAEEVASVDRTAYEARRMPRLAYQRPVSLPPRKARAAANLAAISPGDRVVDPFVGTGALLLEAALLGARASGMDRDPDMVRGALRNLAGFGFSAEALTVGDAGDAFAPPDGGRWDAILTDPPYGRASGSGGEDPTGLIGRVLPAWLPFLAPGARISVVVPGGPDPVPDPWERVVCVPDRVHRSLTREFRVYRRRRASPP